MRCRCCVQSVDSLHWERWFSSLERLLVRISVLCRVDSLLVFLPSDVPHWNDDRHEDQSRCDCLGLQKSKKHIPVSWAACKATGGPTFYSPKQFTRRPAGHFKTQLRQISADRKKTWCDSIVPQRKHTRGLRSQFLSGAAILSVFKPRLTSSHPISWFSATINELRTCF